MLAGGLVGSVVPDWASPLLSILFYFLLLLVLLVLLAGAAASQGVVCVQAWWLAACMCSRYLTCRALLVGFAVSLVFLGVRALRLPHVLLA